MTDLDKLIASVEADMDPGLFYYIPKSLENTAEIIVKAHYGSLDAALRLHEALLPGHPFDVNSTIGVAVSLRSGKWGETADADEWVDTNPARAWLLAILGALKAKEDHNATV